MLFLGIDSGTQSTKAIVLDLDNGTLLAQASQKYDLIDGLPPGHLEQHPHEWLAAVDGTIEGCLAQIGSRRSEIRGIGVSGQQHGLVVLDEKDQVIRPAKLWCDTSTAAQCDELAQAFGGASGLISLAGNAIPPGFTAPKLLWLKQNEPAHFSRIASVLLPHDYINFHLSGVKRMEFGDASGTGLLDIRTRQWRKELFAAIDPGLLDKFPPLGSSLEKHGFLRPELQKKWGLSDGVVIAAGGGDNMMGAIGTGNVRAGVVTASLGTSGTLYATSDQPIIDPQGEVAAFCSSTDQWLPLVCTMNVTVLTEHVRKLFAWDHDQLEAAVKSVPAGAEGLTFLPYLTGERTPNLPNAKGMLHGLNLDNFTPAHLARAAVEGVTVGLAYGAQRFAELGVTPTEIRLTGGGSKSATWRQICADVFGVPVVCLETAEGAGLGAAIQAAHVALTETGQKSEIAALAERLVAVDQTSHCEPQSAASAVYREKLAQQMTMTREFHQVGRL